jgi:ABC-type transport system involved in multi-copper enzyme maturation permease subunit
LISLVIYGVYVYAMRETYNRNPGFLQEAGKQVFQVVILFEIVATGFIGPALTAGAISSERERLTFDQLRISLLSAKDIVIGKLGASVMYLLLLIIAAIPLQSLAFFLGGVGIEEVLISIWILTLSTINFCALGLYFSSIAKRTSTATAISYSMLVLSVLVIGSVAYVIGQNSYLISSTTMMFQRFLINFVWTLLSTNPFSAAFITEAMLVEEQSVFLFFPPDFSLALFSPWILYSVFSITMTVLMIRLIVFYLNRHEP